MGTSNVYLLKASTPFHPLVETKTQEKALVNMEPGTVLWIFGAILKGTRLPGNTVPKYHTRYYVVLLYYSSIYMPGTYEKYYDGNGVGGR